MKGKLKKICKTMRSIAYDRVALVEEVVVVFIV
jgi:hypothetical protein